MILQKELGAYVDDELPDYIMVLVANKKNQAQMKEDLQLFLHQHADVFTAWLGDILNKLKHVTKNPKPGTYTFIDKLFHRKLELTTICIKKHNGSYLAQDMYGNRNQGKLVNMYEFDF